MLNREDNELLCRVGPGTAMGDTLRQYWLPILLSSELPGPDCPPERVKLLGEQLVAFRTTDGEVIAFNCSVPAFMLKKGQLDEDVGPRLLQMVRNIESALGMH